MSPHIRFCSNQILTTSTVSSPPEKPYNRDDVVIKHIVPDNTELYKRTRLLFKNRVKDRKLREIRREAQKQPRGGAVGTTDPLHPFDFTAPRRPQIYRPPPTYSSRSNSESFGPISSSAGPSSKAKSRRKAKVQEPKAKVANSWPPPKDTNSKKTCHLRESLSVQEHDSPIDIPEVESSPFTRKFVNCQLCGKKNLSSLKQLQVHQASKKCKNRQEHSANLCCSVCKGKFDNRHNLKHHKCRIK